MKISVDKTLRDNERFCLTKEQIRDAIDRGIPLVINNLSKTERFLLETVVNEIRLEKLRKING